MHRRRKVRAAELDVILSFNAELLFIYFTFLSTVTPFIRMGRRQPRTVVTSLPVIAPCSLSSESAAPLG